MRPKDIRTVLDSMTVLVDTREQDTERARWRYAAIGLPAIRLFNTPSVTVITLTSKLTF